MSGFELDGSMAQGQVGFQATISVTPGENGEAARVSLEAKIDVARRRTSANSGRLEKWLEAGFTPGVSDVSLAMRDVSVADRELDDLEQEADRLHSMGVDVSEQRGHIHEIRRDNSENAYSVLVVVNEDPALLENPVIATQYADMLRIAEEGGHDISSFIEAEMGATSLAADEYSEGIPQNESAVDMLLRMLAAHDDELAAVREKAYEKRQLAKKAATAAYYDKLYQIQSTLRKYHGKFVVINKTIQTLYSQLSVAKASGNLQLAGQCREQINLEIGKKQALYSQMCLELRKIEEGSNAPIIGVSSPGVGSIGMGGASIPGTSMSGLFT